MFCFIKILRGISFLRLLGASFDNNGEAVAVNSIVFAETLCRYDWEYCLCVPLLNFGKKLGLSVRGGWNLCLCGLTFGLLFSLLDGFVIDRIENLVSDSHCRTDWLASGVLLPVTQLRSLFGVKDWVLQDISFVDRLDLIEGVLQRACRKFSFFDRYRFF